MNNDIVVAINCLTKEVQELSGIMESMVTELQDLNFNMNTGIKYVEEDDE